MAVLSVVIGVAFDLTKKLKKIMLLITPIDKLQGTKLPRISRTKNTYYPENSTTYL